MTTLDRNGFVNGEALKHLAPSAQASLLRHMLADLTPSDNRRIFVNRTLRFEKIRHVGFDMDWTLADYDADALSQLAFEMVLDRLVATFGYPPGILQAHYVEGFPRRGLILDREAGTILKMNRHRYVGRAYRGRNFLGPDERARLYRQEPIQPSSDRFHFADTLFELPEVQLFSELMELRQQGLALPEPAQLFEDARAATDQIHADGSLKARILEDLPRFLPLDPDLPLALQRLALGGRRRLLITNSEWFFTDAICSYLFDGRLPGVDHWRQLFDLVIVSARKPNFFRKKLPFLDLEGEGGEVAVPRWGGVYAGGCREGLMELLDCPGEQVLYIGDHIYGDILSPKRVSTWRTALVVRELEAELLARGQLSAQVRHAEVLRAELSELGRRMDDLADLSRLGRELVPDPPGSPSLPQTPSLAQAEELLTTLRAEHRAMRHHKNRLQERISAAINPYWGSVFKQGSNKSLFGSQVDDFACLYTSRVSNFIYYGRDHYFRVQRDDMMHDAIV